MKIFKLLRTLNILTSIIIVVLAIFILVRPLLPEVYLVMASNEFKGYAYQSKKSVEELGEKAKQLPSISTVNQLVIPKIYVNAEINEGADESALDLGLWRRPNTSTPDRGGNTVITAHRFLHTAGPNTFYHLDKVEIDDLILVYWEEKEYVYKVYSITEIMPWQIGIEYNTKDSILTLYTCTPLWTSEKRLVIKASLQ